MIELPAIDPVAISLGPLNLHWYALTYLAGFFAAWWLGRVRARQPGSGWAEAQVTDLVTNGCIGVIIGGRVGYMLFYQPGQLLDDPLSLVRLWEGGMSFHGGMLGVAVAVCLYARSLGKSVFQVLDFCAPLAPLGLGFGRLGNFINAELWGRPTDMPWAMVFPNDPDRLPRHASQLYQFALEGVVLFAIVWLYSRKPRPAFAVTGMFLLGYGAQRFFVEFFRQPDQHLGFVALDWMTRGQELSIPMILGGILILALAYRKNTFGKLATPR